MRSTFSAWFWNHRTIVVFFSFKIFLQSNCRVAQCCYDEFCCSKNLKPNQKVYQVFCELSKRLNFSWEKNYIDYNIQQIVHFYSNLNIRWYLKMTCNFYVERYWKMKVAIKLDRVFFKIQFAIIPWQIKCKHLSKLKLFQSGQKRSSHNCMRFLPVPVLWASIPSWIFPHPFMF